MNATLPTDLSFLQSLGDFPVPTSLDSTHASSPNDADWTSLIEGYLSPGASAIGTTLATGAATSPQPLLFDLEDLLGSSGTSSPQMFDSNMLLDLANATVGQTTVTSPSAAVETALPAITDTLPADLLGALLVQHDLASPTATLQSSPVYEMLDVPSPTKSMPGDMAAVDNAAAAVISSLVPVAGREDAFNASLPQALQLRRRRTPAMPVTTQLSGATKLPSAAPIAPAPVPIAPLPSAIPMVSVATASADPIDASPDASVSSDMASLKRSRSSLIPEDEQDDSEVTAKKRQKNTEAARRSRLRKALRLETLELRVAELEQQNSEYAAQVEAMRGQENVAAIRDAQLMAHIAALEAKLQVKNA
ncbi:hypothetical protein GQ42DRAFT_93128 [Ramicandelaber brevisporus]|nr:hypothetical protein GQ42DRAFT_93128 [Ramicandelaber brevisporus]